MLGFSCAGSVSVLLALCPGVSIKGFDRCLIAIDGWVGRRLNPQTSQLGHTKYGVWSRFSAFSRLRVLWSVRSCLCFRCSPLAFALLLLALGSSLPPAALDASCSFGGPSWVCFPPFFAVFSCFLCKNTTSPHHTFSAPTHSIFIHLPRNFTLFFLTYDLCWASKDFLTSCVLLSHLGSVAPDVGFFLSLFLAPRTLEGVSDIINNFCCPGAFGLISGSNDSPDDSLDF